MRKISLSGACAASRKLLFRLASPTERGLTPYIATRCFPSLRSWSMTYFIDPTVSEQTIEQLIDSWSRVWLLSRIGYAPARSARARLAVIQPLPEPMI